MLVKATITSSKVISKTLTDEVSWTVTARSAAESHELSGYSSQREMQDKLPAWCVPVTARMPVEEVEAARLVLVRQWQAAED